MPALMGSFGIQGHPSRPRVNIPWRMTIDEKVAQLSGHFPFDFLGGAGFDADRAMELIPHGLGQLSVATAVSPEALEPKTTPLQHPPLSLRENARLHTPALSHREALPTLLHPRAPLSPPPRALPPP